MRNSIKAASTGVLLFGGTLGVSSAAEAGLVTWNCNLAVSKYVNGSYNYGLFVNLETQRYNNDTDAGQVGNNGGALSTWHLGFDALGSSRMNVTAGAFSGLVSPTALSGVAKLGNGVVIGGSLASGLGYVAGPALTANVGSAYRWNDGDTGYFGFQFRNSAGQTRYGWGELSLNAGQRKEGTIVRLVYDDTGASVTTPGAVPAPGAAALVGLAGLVARRRKA